MPQIFSRRVNRAPLILAASLAAAAVVVPLFMWYYFSPEYTDVGYRPIQPIPYSHKLHAGDLRLDCRYCHAMVERSPVATVPPTKVCMNCHQLVKRDSPQLALLRESVATGEPIHWIRVHKVPDYAYFDHSAHVRAGVGCSTCHGDVRQMEVITQMEPLSMGWCLSCHRDPDPYLRPREELTNTTWEAPPDQREVAARLRQERGIDPPVDCSGCHR